MFQVDSKEPICIKNVVEKSFNKNGEQIPFFRALVEDEQGYTHELPVSTQFAHSMRNSLSFPVHGIPSFDVRCFKNKWQIKLIDFQPTRH